MSSVEALPLGTVLLSERRNGASHLHLHPTPSADPNDPLNWSKLRKSINFTLALFYVLFTFVLIDASVVAYANYVVDLGMTFRFYNIATAINYAGLGIGSYLFIPLSYRYGRRVVYIVSLIVQLASAIWAAQITSAREYIGLNALMGLGGAISETLVQVTITDLFFVHQYGTMNGLFIFMQATGTSLGPLAAGYIVESQGWRWMWWWTAIFIGVTFILVVFFFEESTYTPSLAAETTSSPIQKAEEAVKSEQPAHSDSAGKPQLERDDSGMSIPSSQSTAIRQRSYRQRFALITRTNVPIRHHYYQPILMLFRIPAVTYAAITFGSMLGWFAEMLVVASTSFPQPPYSFTPSQIGLFYLSPFAGLVVATATTGPVSDWIIVRMAERNRGIYEPEMRLYPSFPWAVLATAGILMYGLGLAHGESWVLLAFGVGVYTAGFAGCTDIALAYMTDIYKEVIGDAMVAVVLVRNAVALIVMFGLDPWIKGMGVQNTFILTACVAFFLLMAPILLILWGKKWRVSSSALYARLSKTQGRRH